LRSIRNLRYLMIFFTVVLQCDVRHKMIYIEALNDLPDMTGKLSVFLAGGITNCPDFQSQMCEKLQNCKDLVVLNPRRKNFPILDPSQTDAQIKWEYEMLRKANIISFWFPKETLCPIVLFELGSQVILKKPLIIGCHPDYARKQDVVVQVSLARPGIPVFYDLLDVVMGIKYWYGQLIIHI
jgi:hypothetical protein